MSERLKELASKASVGGTLPWVQIPPSPPFVLCQSSYTFQIEAALRLTFHERIQQRLPQEQNSIRSQTSAGHQAYGALVPAGMFRPYGIGGGVPIIHSSGGRATYFEKEFGTPIPWPGIKLAAGTKDELTKKLVQFAKQQTQPLFYYRAEMLLVPHGMGLRFEAIFLRRATMINTITTNRTPATMRIVVGSMKALSLDDICGTEFARISGAYY